VTVGLGLDITFCKFLCCFHLSMLVVVYCRSVYLSCVEFV